MSEKTHHITPYRAYARILISLLFLTAITVMVTDFDFESLTIVVALVIAGIKAFLVLTYFMHLRNDQLIFKLMAGMVFLLLIIVFVLLFFDYLLR